MTNKEKYRRAFGVLHASEDILTEVTHMETKKHFSLRKAVLLCAAVIAVFAMAGVCYAEDVGGIQRTIQLWPANFQLLYFHPSFLQADGQ